MNDQVPQFAWGHININVSNLERSVAFYEKLGFEGYRPGIPYLGLDSEAGVAEMPEACARALGLAATARARACIMQLGRGFPKLDLIEFADQTPAEPLSNADLGIVRLCLAASDLREAYLRLREQGVAFISEPQLCQDGMADIAICMDPDGTLIELIQPHPDKWPSPASRE
ncbi:MAG: VOC family protein [Proteobacteria bacterium]|nr:VOC family protein [Pseudomonadota bacterium]